MVFQYWVVVNSYGFWLFAASLQAFALSFFFFLIAVMMSPVLMGLFQQFVNSRDVCWTIIPPAVTGLLEKAWRLGLFGYEWFASSSALVGSCVNWTL
jgi:hypothetical protein